MSISNLQTGSTPSLWSAARNSEAHCSQTELPQTALPQTGLHGTSSTSESLLEDGEIELDPLELLSLTQEDSAARAATPGKTVLISTIHRRRSADGEANPDLAPPAKRQKKEFEDRSDQIASPYETSSRREIEPSYLPGSSRLQEHSRTSCDLGKCKQINGLICAAARRESIWEIESICYHNEEHLDAVNTATALHRIAQIARATQKRHSSKTIDWLIERSADLLKEFKPQELANIAWALATLGIRDDRFMRDLAHAALQLTQRFKPQDIANIAWAFASLNIRSDSLMQAIADLAKQQIATFKPQNISNTAWAFASLGICNDGLMSALACSAEGQIQLFTAQNLANIAWAFATLRIHSDSMMRAIERSAIAQIEKFKPQELSSLAWAFASLGFCSDPLMKAIAHSAEEQIQKFTLQNLANIAWAFVLLENESTPLLRSIAEVLSNRPHGELSMASMRQLLQVQSALKLYGADFSLIPTDWNLETPIEHTQISGLQREVGSYLKEIVELRGEELKTEFFIPEINHCIDFTTEGIAFEVDGPSHFAFESDTPLGSTLFRNRLLKQLGWKLVCIPYLEWDQLKTAGEKRSYLTQKIERARR